MAPTYSTTPLFLDPNFTPFAQRILSHLSPKERIRFGGVSRGCYQLAMGEPFVSVKGKQQYAVISVLRRSDAESITEQTGLKIPFPAGKSHLGVVNSWEDRSSEKLCLGKGGFGVFCIGYALQSKRWVGLKITMGSDEVDAELRIQQALHGIEGLVHLNDYCRVTMPDGRVILYQMMDLAGLGSVKRLGAPLRSLQDAGLRENILRHVARGFLQGVAAMHEKGFVHLDLKPDNLVVGADGSVLLIDFGCSKNPSDGRINGIYSQGDYNYFSPQRWIASNADDPSEAFVDGRPVDAWAVGASLLELTLEDHLLPMSEVEELLSQPFETLSPSLREELSGLEDRSRWELFQALVERRVGRPHEFGEFLTLVRGLLQYDVSSRKSVEEALSHPWLSAPSDVGDRIREMVQAEPAPSTTISAGGKISPQQKPLPHFVNYLARPALQDALQSRLLTQEQSVLQGAPGSGKTQLATYVIHTPEIKAKFSEIYWFVGSDTPAHLESQLLTLAQELELSTPEEQFEDVFPRLQHHLTQRPCLLVYDNGDDPDKLKPYLIDGCSRLITTRSTEWDNLLRVGSLSRAEGTFLINKLLQKEEPHASELSETLADLPLALAQACAFIRNQRFSISDYLKLFERTPTLLAHDSAQDGHKKFDHTIDQMYELTFAELSKQRALPLLQRLCCLASDNIPQDLVSDLIRGPDMDPDAEQRLVDYAILQPTGPGMYGVHRLPRERVRTSMAEGHLDAALSQTLSTFRQMMYREDSEGDVSTRSDPYLVRHGKVLKETWDRVSTPSRTLEDAMMLALLPLMRAVAERGDVEQLKEFETCLRDLAARRWGDKIGDHHVLRGLASAAALRGDYAAAVRDSEKALTLIESQETAEGRTGDQRSRQYATLLAELGVHQMSTGQPIEARLKFLTALGIDRHHRDAASEQSNLTNAASTSIELGEFETATGELEQAMAIAEREGTPLSVELLNNLALTWRKRGDLVQAEKFYRRSLQLAEERYGEDHPALAVPLSNLGNLLADQEKHSDAVGMYQRAQELLKRVHGPDHPNIARLMANEGVAWRQLGNVDRAVQQLKSAYDMRVKLLGARHPDTRSSMSNLAAAHAAEGNFEMACRLAKDVVRLAEELEVPYSGIYCDGLRALANYYSHAMRHDDAIETYQELLRALIEPESQEVGEVRKLLGDAYFEKEEFEEAVAEHQTALRILANFLDEEDFILACIHSYIGRGLYELDREEEAIEHHTLAHQGRVKHLGADHQDTLDSRIQRALCYDCLDRTDEAIRELESVVEDATRSSKLGPASEYTQGWKELLDEMRPKRGRVGRFLKGVKKVAKRVGRRAADS